MQENLSYWTFDVISNLSIHIKNFPVGFRKVFRRRHQKSRNITNCLRSQKMCWWMIPWKSHQNWSNFMLCSIDCNYMQKIPFSIFIKTKKFIWIHLCIHQKIFSFVQFYFFSVYKKNTIYRISKEWVSFEIEFAVL